MADNNIKPTLIRGSNNTGNATILSSLTPSRLLENTNSLRNDLQSRNLYTPNNIYPITEKNQAQNIINAVSSISSIVAPFKSYNLKNTVYGRLLNPAEATPLTEIGLVMLGKQFALNAGSHVLQQNLPVVKIGNLFDGVKNTRLFTKNIDLKITKTSVSNFQNFINNNVIYNPTSNYLFDSDNSQANYIKNTGVGQLSYLYTSLNQNIYKGGFTTGSDFFGIKTIDQKILYDYSSKNFADTQLLNRSSIVNADNSHYKKYFSFLKTNPYTNITPNDNSINMSNDWIGFQLNNPELNSRNTQEYAPTADFVEKNLGVTNIRFKEVNGFKLGESGNEWINSSIEFNTDSLTDKLIWGKNGIASKANGNINRLRGNFNEITNTVPDDDLPNTNFNAYSGLLEYTRNLLNASEGAVVDITRKAFVNKNSNIVGFNGSSLWLANNLRYAQMSDTANSTGVRQHSILDQYDRFAKAIRFNGNIVYGGNENSVIYDSVMPRIHPTLPPHEKSPNQPNNRNLMFSLENLAVRVISSDEGIGIIDDEYGSQIPICEVGQFNGRLMWFPPYNLEINESTQSNFEKTTMVGRNEPMYNYMHSERSATLNFTMLIDYPQHLKNYTGKDKHREIAEFFAFGGNPYNPTTVIRNTKEKEKTNNDHIEKITGPVDMKGPDIILPKSITAVFPNDKPDVNEVNNIINDMYLDIEYQILSNSLQSNKGISSGLNSEIYFITGMTSGDEPVLDKTQLPVGFSQYNYNGIKSELDIRLNELFKPEENRRLYGIKITGAASKLNDNKIGYNDALGLRRANALKYLIEERFKKIFPGEDLSEVKFFILSVGASGADPKNSSGNSQKEIMDKLESVPTILERYGTIEFVGTGEIIPKKIPPMSFSDTLVVSGLRASNQPLITNQNNEKNNDCVMNVRGENDAIQNGFRSIESNYYNPVFHTQTPEDFHRRLTFLQQCMRQGAAKRYDIVDEAGIPRAKNSVFGRQPICVLRIGDFFFTKVIIENLSIDYADTTWDMNPEGFGMQPMMAKITLQMKIIGGQSLKGPIDALQNAITFNYYANSNFTNKGLYERPDKEAENQEAYINNILTTERSRLESEYKKKYPPKQ